MSRFRIVIAIILLSIGYKQPKTEYKTRVDDEFNKRFELYGGGLTGADGTYSVLLHESKRILEKYDYILLIISEQN